MDAVSEGTKPLGCYSAMLDGFWGSDSEREFVREPLKSGLTVVVSPIDVKATGINIFVLRNPDSLSRVRALIPILESRTRHGSSDPLEELTSNLLGYSPDEIRKWAELQHWRNAAWSSPTLYLFVPKPLRPLFESVGQRCIPPNLDSDGLRLFRPVNRDLRTNAYELLPDQMDLARFSLRTRHVTELLSEVDGTTPPVIEYRIPDPVLLNKALVSTIQFLSAGGWS